MPPKRRYILGVAGIALLFVISLGALRERPSGSGYSWSPASFAPSGLDTVSGKEDHRVAKSSLPLPAEYNAAILANLSEPVSDFCRDRMSAQFLEQFSQCRASYCSEDSVSDLTCFHTASPTGSKDSFCLIRDGISFDIGRRKFTVDCQLRNPSPLGGGVGNLPKEAPKHSMAQSDSFVVLLKREVDGNIWHCINEIMALMTTLDVLKITPRSDSGPGAGAVLGPGAIPKTEIVILDDLSDGNYFELFQMFSGTKPERLDEWIARKRISKTAESVSSVGNVIVPFAGSANPLWSDWKPMDCTDNTMLRVFVQRIFDLYGLPRTRQRNAASSSPPRRLRVTLIVRKSSRQLLGLDTWLAAALRARYAGLADIGLVDFEGMPFRAQVAAARDTDVLVGMHGAGLTHAMFMEEGRGALVEIQPDRLCHWGFRNLARMTGQAYFVAGAGKIVGNCYAVPESLRGEGEGNGAEAGVEVLPDDGKGAVYDPSRCYVHTTDAAAWSLGCSDPRVTGGERSFWVCRHRDADDAWYRTCKKKEAADIWWMTRYIMEQDRFVKLVGEAIETVRRAEEASR
ncbi:hypothetical protein PG991_001889 [Apiospora marii]|uniref:EGF domain-specific O-linked N-acetylglucosamine transferase n=1 Tax=Apiospora marii TaxID=335849 RepID=A0ABR1SNA5_9PEZI